jgi:hypothetical protein
VFFTNKRAHLNTGKTVSLSYASASQTARDAAKKKAKVNFDPIAKKKLVIFLYI